MCLIQGKYDQDLLPHNKYWVSWWDVIPFTVKVRPYNKAAIGSLIIRDPGRTVLFNCFSVGPNDFLILGLYCSLICIGDTSDEGDWWGPNNSRQSGSGPVYVIWYCCHTLPGLYNSQAVLCCGFVLHFPFDDMDFLGLCDLSLIILKI